MNALPRRRVAVTGWAVLSPGGAGIEAYRRWREDGARIRTQAAGSGARLVPGFDPAEYVANPKRLRSMHRNFQMMAAAAVLAMRDAGLPRPESLPASGLAPARAGLATAIADVSPLTRDVLEVLAQMPAGAASPEPWGGAATDWAAFSEIALHHLHPFRRLGLLANMATAHTSLLFGLQGPSFTFTTGAAGGTQAVTQAFWTVAHRRADLMVCQSAETPEQAFAAAPPDETGGALVLESWESAQRRGAAIHAELLAGEAPPEPAARPVVGAPAGTAPSRTLAGPGKAAASQGAKRTSPTPALLGAVLAIASGAGPGIRRISLPELETLGAASASAPAQAAPASPNPKTQPPERRA